jgi:RNA polymerase sigma-70 factor (ECF subfamily)
MNVPNTEADLLAAAKTGDSRAAAALYQSYFRLLYGYLYHRLGSAPLAEDIAQETFLRAFKGLAGFTGKASFKNWLFQITKHLVADHWQSQSKHAHIQFTDVYELSDTSFASYCATMSTDTALAQQAETAATAVQQILQQLPAEYRAILEYRFLHGYSLRETAAALNITLANAKVRQYRALQRAKTIANSLSLL